MKDCILIDPSKLQLKGNIHMHTVRSDGHLTPEEAAERYRRAGYDFIMISDHEIYWNSTELDRPDFLVLGGTESAIEMNNDYCWIIDYRNKKANNDNNRHAHQHMHLCCIKDESIPDVGQYYAHNERVPRQLDRGIDSWNAKIADLNARGNLVVVNHPHWSRLTGELLLATQNVIGMEIFNSGDVFHCGGRSDEEIWDHCLRLGKHLNVVAADDSHKYTTDFAKGFTVVQTDEFSKAGICRGFKAGNFYASTGPMIHEMKIEDGVLKMRFTPARHVKIAAYDPDGDNFCNEDGSLFESIEWKINKDLRYFRVVVIDEQGREAWTQPVFTEELL